MYDVIFDERMKWVVLQTEFYHFCPWDHQKTQKNKQILRIKLFYSIFFLTDSIIFTFNSTTLQIITNLLNIRQQHFFLNIQNTYIDMTYLHTHPNIHTLLPCPLWCHRATSHFILYDNGNQQSDPLHKILVVISWCK